MRNRLLKNLFGSAALVALQSTNVLASQAWVPDDKALIWSNGRVEIGTLDCISKGYSGIVVRGTVTLYHPNASDDNINNIKINCSFIIFENGAQIFSREALEIKITKQAGGQIVIKNNRGTKGEDAKPRPDLWAINKKPKANNGPHGGNGRDARTDLAGDWSADAGGRGHDGSQGENGANGNMGEPGGAGKSAARIWLKTASFADGSTVLATAIGGDGGNGGKGGRGQDGGDGGDGGNGGKGGDGNAVHDGASGGNGGNGGNGGDGGNGGQGGPGGPGGNGADVIITLLKGGQPPEDFDLQADGGQGARGGEGGDFGLGGVGGKFGSAGCGGSGGHFIWNTGGGNCGTNGINGQPGKPGHKGPPGVFGPNGSNGNNKLIDLNYVGPAEF